MILDEETYLQHYGVLRKSGRYPWGSGSTQSARNQTFLDVVEELRKQGVSDAKIGEMFSDPNDKKNALNSTDIRALKSIAKNDLKQDQIRRAIRLQEKGLSNVKIGEAMGLNESSVRSLLAPAAKEKADILKATAEMLRQQVAEKGYIDIGVGVNRTLPSGISEDKLKVAVALLREEGYKKHYVDVQQLGTGKDTSLKVLGAPDSKQPRPEQVRGIVEQHTNDGGRTWGGIKPPISISSKRVAIRYAEDGGTDADGVIYVRPGVKDLSIGNKKYAQVRIMVDGTHYLKGMALEKDDLPAGIDLVFNTNKKNTGNKLDAMKPLKDDADSPFGSIVRQLEDPVTGKVTSAMNIVNDEGDWGKWSKSLSSQVLSKQAPALAKTQLDMTYDRRKNEFDEIMALTNPTVKRKLLESFADSADSAAVHLKAAALPGQATHVILPVNTMKKDEIYAPNYPNGTRVALIRYPHGGKFEIPELTVNNKHVPAQKLLGKQAKVAVGIHHSVAERLSGADFDGDTVLVIPNNRGSIKSDPPLRGLKDFDSKQYKIPDGDTTTKRMTKANTQPEMGKITNLISDMTIAGAGTDHLARAIKHSMVVIDAEKHGLDYRASARDNGIAALKANYQGVSEKGNAKGAATLITRAKSPEYVLERRERRASEGGKIDPLTGKKVFVNTDATKTSPDRVHKRTGEVIPGKTELVKQRMKKLEVTDDAHTLSSGTVIESVYADHSNRLKALANEARRSTLGIPALPKASAATKLTYKSELESLNAKLNVALRNAPVERQAQLLANAQVRLKRQANPNLEASDISKIKAQALAEARVRTGAKKERIVLTQKEWDAIQSGAISNHKLEKILANTDLDQIKELATPKTPRTVTATQLSRANQMLASGYTQAEVAATVGIPVSTLMDHIE